MTQPNGSYLTRKDILAAKDLAYADVDTPEWGGVTRVRELSAQEALELGNATQAGGGVSPDDFMKIAALVIVDSEGKPCFTEKDLILLGRHSLPPIKRVVEATLRMSTITDEAAEESGKPSSSTTADVSLSD